MKFEDWATSNITATATRPSIAPISAARMAWDAALSGSAFQVTLNKLERDKAGRGFPYVTPAAAGEGAP